MTTTPVVIIHGSDISNWKKCRQLWAFSSNLHMNLEPIPMGTNAFWFGTGIHESLAAFALADNSPTAARGTWLSYCESSGVQTEDGNLLSGFLVDDDTYALGRDMLTYYCESWAPRHDRMQLVHAERAQLMPMFKLTRKVGEYPVGTRIYYGYKLDALVKDEHGRHWIREFKTAGKFEGNYDYLLNDEQPGRYWWAEQKRLGLPIEGVDYIILKKKAVQHLKLNQDGHFSRDRRQDTTYETALEDIRAHHGDKTALVLRGLYKDYLDFLRDKPDNFVLRHTVRRNPSELRYIEESLRTEIKEMLSDPPIYRSPSMWNCNSCQFFEPCLQKWEGSDYRSTLQLRYRQREEIHQGRSKEELVSVRGV